MKIWTPKGKQNKRRLRTGAVCMRVRVVALQTNNLQKEIRSRDKTRSTLATMSRVPENTGLFDAYKSLNMKKKLTSC